MNIFYHVYGLVVHLFFHLSFPRFIFMSLRVLGLEVTLCLLKLTHALSGLNTYWAFVKTVTGKRTRKKDAELILIA